MSIQYHTVAEARSVSGLRLALTAGSPGPWGESAKGVLHVKGLDYVPVLQESMGENLELLAWTGHRNAPVIMVDGEAPKTTPEQILSYAERTRPEPRLIPADGCQRALMFGLLREITGEGGLGWCRRQIMMAMAMDAEQTRDNNLLLRDYGHANLGPAGIRRHIADVLDLLAAQLRGQQSAGSRYFIGEAISGLDIYWAIFSNLVQPLGPEDCPMDDGIRYVFSHGLEEMPEVADLALLIAHRDMMFAEHLLLPMSF